MRFDRQLQVPVEWIRPTEGEAEPEWWSGIEMSECGEREVGLGEKNERLQANSSRGWTPEGWWLESGYRDCCCPVRFFLGRAHWRCGSDDCEGSSRSTTGPRVAPEPIRRALSFSSRPRCGEGRVNRSGRGERAERVVREFAVRI
jgi:hypothetical protein